jgi:chromosome segregation ATPase
MSDFKSVRQLCEENPNLNNHVLSLADEIDKLEKENQDLVKRHIELENSLIELRKYHKEFEQFAATVYDPKKSTYKELEEKVAKANEQRQKDIDELWETRIDPLRFELEDTNKKLDLLKIENSNLSTRTKQLNEAIEDLEVLINYAVGYISSCEQFKDKNPNDVKNWLFEGLK